MELLERDKSGSSDRELREVVEKVELVLVELLGREPSNSCDLVIQSVAEDLDMLLVELLERDSSGPSASSRPPLVLLDVGSSCRKLDVEVEKCLELLLEENKGESSSLSGYRV